MNKRLFAAAIVAGFIALITAGTANAQLGGYKAISKSDPAAQGAAEFAVSAEAEKTGKTMSLADVIKAERQSVAGANYRLCLKVNSEGGEGQDDVTIFVQAIVYVDLKGESALKSWAISECGDGDDGD